MPEREPRGVVQLQAGNQEQVRLASLGWRVAATLIDTVALFICLVVLLGVAAAAGVLQLPDANVTNPFDVEATRATMPTWIYVATYGLLFFYYSVLEGIMGASLGKLALGMRVRMDDGGPATLTAVIVRNLIRIPEAFFWYIPSAISCLTSSRDKRLGDFAAGTVVVRRAAVAPVNGASGAAAARPVASTQVSAGPSTGAAPEAIATADGLPDALSKLKAAVLAARGAHDTFLRFSEMELARHPEDQAEGAASYSPEYVAAWYSLSDAVLTMNQAHDAAVAASRRAGTTFDAALAGQPDLTYLLRKLAPYLATDVGERLHEAYMQVVRAEIKA